MILCPKCQQQTQQLTRCGEFPAAGQVSEIQTRAVHTLASEAGISGQRGRGCRGLEGKDLMMPAQSLRLCKYSSSLLQLALEGRVNHQRVVMSRAPWGLLWSTPMTSPCYHCLFCITSFHLTPERG